MKPLELYKGSILLEPGTVCDNLYFLVEGVAREIWYQGDKEVTSWFSFEGEFFTASSFFSQKPTSESIVLVSDSKLLYISHTSLHYLYDYDSDPIWNKVGRLMMEQYFMALEEHFVSHHSQSAAERYNKLLQKFPEILDKVSLKHIASYLGITQETLSRIRTKYEARKRLSPLSPARLK
ncbi:cyclic nucleotide-binding protein [Dulcicalothrix desertica PCC 7102]|uniref:Cyclic nucleotide-binding protein n=1 Tax=Dulcicalothrix desertica PCC 7102 TaxID=232991 RepID=A0A433V235_9CYAN|nr:Crp/Fnr family transcriptional regulator [Dulcicalothrix desertica]RUT00155.1 cyclic nucleotide-binding protein [Dulcicalothrix desertica PCC 7102]TWH55622.1 CRP-like cAMP-binding protein [Dulcicalothrix desertica PCC 7102]